MANRRQAQRALPSPGLRLCRSADQGNISSCAWESSQHLSNILTDHVGRNRPPNLPEDGTGTPQSYPLPHSRYKPQVTDILHLSALFANGDWVATTNQAPERILAKRPHSHIKRCCCHYGFAPSQGKAVQAELREECQRGGRLLHREDVAVVDVKRTRDRTVGALSCKTARRWPSANPPHWYSACDTWPICAPDRQFWIILGGDPDNSESPLGQRDKLHSKK